MWQADVVFCPPGWTGDVLSSLVSRCYADVIITFQFAEFTCGPGGAGRTAAALRCRGRDTDQLLLGGDSVPGGEEAGLAGLQMGNAIAASLNK